MTRANVIFGRHHSKKTGNQPRSISRRFCSKDDTSHEEPSDHTYTVHLEGGIPSDCTCPAFEYREGSCKHQVAVAIREPVLEAVSAEPRMKTDGGVTVEPEEPNHFNERPDDCDCSPLFEELPCWPCYRDGFEEPNPNVEEEVGRIPRRHLIEFGRQPSTTETGGCSDNCGTNSQESRFTGG